MQKYKTQALKDKISYIDQQLEILQSVYTKKN